MAWSGVEGADGEIRTDPLPTHRHFRQNGYASQSHTFSAQPTPSRRPTASVRSGRVGDLIMRRDAARRQRCFVDGDVVDVTRKVERVDLRPAPYEE